VLQREIDLLKLLKNPCAPPSPRRPPRRRATRGVGRAAPWPISSAGPSGRYIVKYMESFNTRATLYIRTSCHPMTWYQVSHDRPWYGRYIVMEFVENGSLASIVKRYGRLPESLTGMYTLQVLEGLHYLHDQGVIHRDIKGANILVSTNGQVKLADFGVATKLESGLDSGAGTVVGTPYRMAPEPERLPSVRERPPSRGRYWMAPEIIQLSGFSAASDVWSVGCTVIELISAKPPFFDLPPMSALFRIVNDPHPPIPEGTSPALTDFLLLCFRRDTAQRPSARALQTHPWLALLLVHTRLERGIRFTGDGRVRCN
jgi:serine/threonine protein kinase